MQICFRPLAKRYSLAGCLLILITQSCVQKTPEQTASEWTEKMKQEIMTNAGQQPDKTTVDSVHHETTLYKNGKVIRHYYFTPIADSNDIDTGGLDTGMVIYYSTNPDFQFVRQPCRPGVPESYEIVAYKGNRYGMAKYFSCDGSGSQTGYQYNNLNVGTWITYDSTGTIAKQVDAGNREKLKSLDSMTLVGK